MMTAKMRYQPFACGTGGTVSTLSTQARRPARTYREEIEERVEVLANQTSRVQVQFATEQDQQGKAQEVLPRVSHGLLYMRQEKGQEGWFTTPKNTRHHVASDLGRM
jgi:hypothetical protein